MFFFVVINIVVDDGEFSDFSVYIPYVFKVYKFYINLSIIHLLLLHINICVPHPYCILVNGMYVTGFIFFLSFYDNENNTRLLHILNSGFIQPSNLFPKLYICICF